MRKLYILSFLTLDGVMQSDDGPEVDPSGGFTYGGWSTPYFDDFLEQTLDEHQFVQFSQAQTVYANCERIERSNKTISGLVGDVGKEKLPHRCLSRPVQQAIPTFGSYRAHSPSFPL